MNRLLVVCAAFVAGAAIGAAASWLILDQGERPGVRPESPAVAGAASVGTAAPGRAVRRRKPALGRRDPSPQRPRLGTAPDVDLAAINAGHGHDLGEGEGRQGRGRSPES